MTDLRNRVDPAMGMSPRRKYLTIMFSDLTGSTQLAGRMEAEDYGQLLNRLAAAYQKVIPQFGGTVVQISGDGLLAIFGYPDASEDDGCTAVMAALELHGRVRALDDPQGGGTPLRLHTGIHSGLVLLHDGDAVRGRFELLGGATNIACRLAHAAQPDEILVSEATIGPDRGRFQTGERQLLALKGKETPIAAVNVIAAAPVATRFAARERKGVNPFVGRDEELGRLSLILDRAAAGQPTFVAVDGPRGVGKTRLVSELLRRAGGEFHVYRGECDAHLGAEPLQPFLQILRSVLGITRPIPGEHQADAIEAALAALDPSLTQHRPVLLHLLASADAQRRVRRPVATAVTTALKALVARLAEEEPLALFIDDWQWADDASQRLLESLRDLGGSRLLVLLTMCSEDSEEGFDNFERLVLAPLSDEEAKRAIRQVLPNADTFLVGKMCAAAGGNPLFLEELCHSVAYGEQDFRTHGGSGWLDILIASRFARLPSEQGDLLGVASVIGNIIPVWLLEQVTGHGEKDPLVRALAEQDFLFPGERSATLRFKHGVTRDVIYDSVGLRERRALHLRIAETFRDHGAITGEEEFYEALAYHYGAGGDVAAAADYAELAGDKAMERSAMDRAQFHYRAALGALDRLPQSDARRWQKIARRFGLAAAFEPEEDQLAILKDAVGRAAARDDPLAMTLAQYWLAYISYALGHTVETIAQCEQAVETATIVGEKRLMVQVRALLGQARALAGDYQAALPLLDESIGEMRQNIADPGDVIGIAYAISCKGFALADLGRFEEAYAYFGEALSAVKGSEHAIEASILSHQQGACLWQGRLQDAAALAAGALQVAARVRTLYVYNRNLSAEAYVRWMVSGDESAIGQLIESTTSLEDYGHELYLSLNYGWLAEMMAAGGRAVEARHFAARALMQIRRRRDRLGEAMSYRALARLASSQHQPQRAERYLARALSASEARGSAHEIASTRLRAAEIALDQGDREEALALLDQAGSDFARMEMPWHAGEAARLRDKAAS